MKIVFLHGTHDYWKYYLENTKVSYDVDIVFGRTIFTKSLFLRILSKIHLSDRIRKKISLPLRYLWCGKLIPVPPKYDDRITFLIYTSYIASLPFNPQYFIKYLRKNYNCKIAIMFGNTVESEKPFIDCDVICPMADLVCSYNTEDIGKYNIQIHPTLFFNVNIPLLPLSQRPIDVFFIGQEKGRGKEINKLYKTLSKYGLKCEFYIVGFIESEKVDGIHYTDWIPYSFVVERLKETRCILNLLWKGSQGVTIRDMEAYNNGCFILKNCVDNSLYDVLNKEQILLTSDINENMAKIIKKAHDPFPKKGKEYSFDIFYQWIVDKSWM